MNTALVTLRTLGRAAVVTIAMAGLGLAAAPAQAADSFSFQLGLGSNGSVMSFGFSNKGYGKNYHPIKKCLSDWQVRQGVENHGFRRVQIVDHLPRHQVTAEGFWKTRLYALKVDACSGKVYDVQRVRNQGNGFGFQFQFGN
ncbi:MAG TPA: hypothetical protein VFO41_01275 [Alphaproteobacteria bacterium]|nr:hypothetical protein [Alphaproteobacteria bacterium]